MKQDRYDSRAHCCREPSRGMLECEKKEEEGGKGPGSESFPIDTDAMEKNNIRGSEIPDNLPPSLFVLRCLYIHWIKSLRAT